jgi:hypothetical protein
MPYEASEGNHNAWFSYDYGNVHMISISTEECFESTCPQMVWVENDMKKAYENRDNVPWIVLSMHRPMYCSDTGTTWDNAFQNAMEPLVLKYDVDLVLQGHVHAYERIHPSVNGDVTVYPKHTYSKENNKFIDTYYSEGKGPVYVVQGNTGAMQFETWTHPKPDWSAVRFANGYQPPMDVLSQEGKKNVEGIILESNYTDTFGFGVATFVNSTHLHYSCIPVTGTIGTDDFWIVKRV